MIIEYLAKISEAFVLGLLTPLTAACVLPLYPGFLVYLSNQLSGKEQSRKTIALFGFIVSFGVVLFMTLFGLIFTTILKASLTNVIEIISPIAFGILIIISILLIFNIDIARFLPRTKTPGAKNPMVNAFLFGFFFGAIVIPCNPLFIAVLFTRTVSTIDFLGNLLRFLFFGVGMAFPLLVFSLLSTASSGAIIGFLLKHKRSINLTAGVIMLTISTYYLIFVFSILEWFI